MSQNNDDRPLDAEPLTIERHSNTVEDMLKHRIANGEILVLAVFATDSEFHVELDSEAAHIIPSLIEYLKEVSRVLAN